MPKRVGDVVFPMDGASVWPRTSPQGKPSVYVTRVGDKRWQRLDTDLPKGQAMTADTQKSVGFSAPPAASCG